MYSFGDGPFPFEEESTEDVHDGIEIKASSFHWALSLVIPEGMP